MKKVNAALAIALAVALASCSYLEAALINSKSSMQACHSSLAKLVDPNARISSLTFLNWRHHLGSEMGTALLSYCAQPDSTPMVMQVDLYGYSVTSNKEEERKAGTPPCSAGATINSIDLTSIPDLISQATDSLRKHNLEYGGTRYLTIQLTNGQKPAYSFELSGKLPGYKCQTRAVGRRTFKTYCYCSGVSFTVDTLGNMAMQKPKNPLWTW